MKDNTAQSQKQRLAYQKVKQRVLQEHAKKKLGRSKTFTREQVDDLAPIDEELTEADKAAIVEVGAHVSMMEVDAPRKRQADAHTETSPTKHRVMKPELTGASPSLGSSAKHAPAEPKISTAVKRTKILETKHQRTFVRQWSQTTTSSAERCERCSTTGEDTSR